MPMESQFARADAPAQGKALAAYSVLMSVWAGEKPELLTQSLDSLLSQTVPPNEIVLVEDGPLTPGLEEAIASVRERAQGILKTVPLPKNAGLGAALKAGLTHCSFELVARMDSDDICYPERMQRQLEYFAAHPETDILSGVIDEFDGEPKNITGSRVVPLQNDDIWAFAKTRSPFNHAAVMFKKSSVLKAGSYRGDLPRVEDHDLWMRMYRNGAVGANLSDHLLLVRGGRDMHKRRHGLRKARALRQFYREMYLQGEIGYAHYLADVFCACGLQLMPAWLHSLCYKLLRKNTKPYTAPKKGAAKAPSLPRGDRLLRELTSEESDDLRAQELALYRDVKRVCDEKGLRLILSGGSCLGAVREGGFIPWDDDMDAVMPRADYERLRELFDRTLGERYEMHCPACEGHAPTNLFMKISLKGAGGYAQVMQAGTPAPTGPWLDIVPMEYAPESVLRRWIKGLACDALAFGAVSRYLYQFRNPLARAYMSDTLRRRLLYALRLALGFALSFKSYEAWYALYDRFSQGEESAFVTFPAGIRHYIGEALPLESVLPPAQGTFEGEPCLLPAKAHSYLKQLYGSDYLTPPPPEARRGHLFLKREYEDRLR